jgi:YHS domain-containing protein
MNSRTIFIALVFGFFLLAPVAWAGPETNTSVGITGKGSGLAVHGYDTVAYFTEHRAVKGSSTYAVEYKGATYRFVSAENMKLFKNNPEKYAPQYGGYCAFGVAMGAKFDGDSDYWTVHEGKLYLNLNGDVLTLWRKDIPRNLDIAGHNWKKIATKSPGELTPYKGPQKIK